MRSKLQFCVTNISNIFFMQEFL